MSSPMPSRFTAGRSARFRRRVASPARRRRRTDAVRSKSVVSDTRHRNSLRSPASSSAPRSTRSTTRSNRKEGGTGLRAWRSSPDWSRPSVALGASRVSKAVRTDRSSQYSGRAASPPPASPVSCASFLWTFASGRSRSSRGSRTACRRHEFNAALAKDLAGPLWARCHAWSLDARQAVADVSASPLRYHPHGLPDAGYGWFRRHPRHPKPRARARFPADSHRRRDGQRSRRRSRNVHRSGYGRSSRQALYLGPVAAHACHLALPG